MKARVVIAIALLAAATASQAQFVKGNEAVKAMPDGSRKVETPPIPAGPVRNTTPCAANAGCHAGMWHMVETTTGLVECTEAYARPTTCRASTFGSSKVSRVWVVKTGGNWLQCQHPDLKSKCVNMFARPPANLPQDAVQ